MGKKKTDKSCGAQARGCKQKVDFKNIIEKRL